MSQLSYENSFVQRSVSSSVALSQQEKTLSLSTQENKQNRVSGLASPTILLSGHESEVLTVAFSKDGLHVASGSFDKTILVYEVYGECKNVMLLKGHQNAVLQLNWSNDSSEIYSCSADTTVCIWDVETERRIKKLKGHTAVVNAVDCDKRNNSLLVSGADDGTTRIWDLRTNRCQSVFEHNYQIFSAVFDRASHRIFSGSLDNTILVYDLRNGKVINALKGHEDSVTSVAMSNLGDLLLSFSFDTTVRVWDIQPFSTVANETSNSCLAVFTGATQNFERNLIRCDWSSDDSKVICGSADRLVYVWDYKERRLLYRIPGHVGCVNDVAFHPKEPIIASASSDKTVFIGELS